VHDARNRLFRELRITRVLDVGANIGQYAIGLREHGYDGRIVSFEPIADVYTQLASTAAADPLWQTRQLALADRSGRGTLNVSANSFSSSLLPISSVCVTAAPEAAYVRTEEVELGTLDELRLSQEPTLLKIDAQGYESQVLEGGKRFLRDVLAVELELSLVPLYEGQELAADVCTRLRRHSFVPVAFETEFLHPLTGEILQINGLFRTDAAAAAPYRTGAGPLLGNS
jgi:FkbM family methyltransferase